MRFAALAAMLLCAALFAAGCGGSSGGSNTTAPEGGGAAGGGAPKKASAPNAPAGSEVLACEGGGEAAQLRATAVDCGTAREVMASWQGDQVCALPAGASRSSCSVEAFRCQGTKTDAGLAVSCARPDADIAFLVKE